MTMMANQRRKRLNGVSGGGCSSVGQFKMKKRKLECPQNYLNSKSHISLEWDEKTKKVVAKKEQIGISRRNLKPFVGCSSGSNNVLADVFSVPEETFELDNLIEVVSYEVWQTLLSEEERNFLVQFLPSGQNAEQIVEALLAGYNFHFGNSFLKWGASLCSSNFHPDAVLQKERCLKADKKAYYLELQKYHNDIINYLQKLKERWENCKDPEKEILPKICRSRRDVERRLSSNGYEFGLRDLEQDVTGTSESCSWVADEKSCSSDNQNSSVVKGGELQKRKSEKGFMKDKSRNLMIASEDVLNVVAKSKKGEKLNKRNIHHNDGVQYMSYVKDIHHNDGVQYMSYVKISKKQLELVKSMKQAGKSIQSRSLNRFLGNLDGLRILPYEAFVEEEQKKSHEHWLQLVNEDLPACYANRRERQLQMWEVVQSLGQEMKDKLKYLTEDEERDNAGMQNEEIENPVVQDKEVENNEAVPQDQKDDGASDCESEDEESAPSSPWDQSPQQITSPSGSHELNHTDVVTENKCAASKSANSSSDELGNSGKMNSADDTVSQEAPLSSVGDVWPAIGRPHSYYDCTASRELSASRLPLMNSHVNEDQQAHLIDLESDLHEEDIGQNLLRRRSDDDSISSYQNRDLNDLLCRQSDDGSLSSYQNLDRNDLLHRQSDDGSLSSYQNQDRNELLQSLFKGREMLSYHQEHKQTGLDVQPLHNSMIADNGHFLGHFNEQLETLAPEQGQKRLDEILLQQNISDNIYSDRGRFLIPRQENLQMGNMHNWTVNPVRISEPVESHLNCGELLSHNWFSDDYQVRGGWTNSGGVSIQSQSQSIGNGSIGDQSLFNVLPSCSQLRSVNPHDSTGSTEQFLSSRNYGLIVGGVPGINNALPNTAHPLDYLGGRDSLMPDDMGWMNMPLQNPALRDPIGKPYLRSWNQ